MSDVPPGRWIERLDHYRKAVEHLVEAVQLDQERPLSELEKAGFVQRFEIAWELGWKLMADFLSALQTPPRNYSATMAVRGAFAAAIIDDGDAWIAAGNLRHALSHGYDEAKRDEALAAVRERFLAMFRQLIDRIESDAR